MKSVSLTRPQQESVGLLSIGTFLEYFDLCLYIHMAVILNKLFFPQTDKLMAQLLGAFSFSSTFVLRPLGGYLIGRLGDKIGRKYTIMLTTLIMSGCCMAMASLPTYDQIGITASVVMIVCRSLQGFSSMGEKLGAQLYISEMLGQPNSYVYNWVIQIQTDLGGLFALFIALSAIYYSFNWRVAFWIGAAIALVGVAARTKLRETPEYIDYQIRLRKKGIEVDVTQDKIDKKAALCYFAIKIFTPVGGYMSYIYLIDIARNFIQLELVDIILHNLILCLLILISLLITTYITKRYHPITIARGYILLLLINLIPMTYYIAHISGSLVLYYLQLVTFIPSLCMPGIEMSCFKHINIKKRFTTLGTASGLASMFAYGIIPVSLVFLTQYFGNYALLFVYIPLMIAFFIASNYIKKLEIDKGYYNEYPNQGFPHKDTAYNEEEYDYSLGKEFEVFAKNCQYSSVLIDNLQKISKAEGRKLNMKLIEKAIVFAKKFHGNHMRKTGDVPFYSHPLEVARMVAQYYCKTDVIVSAILHDVVEDSECTVDLIKQEFNGRIAQMVDRLTKKRNEHGEDIELSFDQTMNRIESLGDFESAFIKKMDRSHNLITIEGLNSPQQNKMAKETNNILVRLISVIGDKLGLHGKIEIENNISQRCNLVLKNDGKK